MSRGENTFAAKGSYGTPEEIAYRVRHWFGVMSLDPCAMPGQLINAEKQVVFFEGDLSPLEEGIKEVQRLELVATGLRRSRLRSWFLGTNTDAVHIPNDKKVRRILHASLEGREPVLVSSRKCQGPDGKYKEQTYGGDGLAMSWAVPRLFLNPPFHQVRFIKKRPWLPKLDEPDEVTVLTKAAVSANWWQDELMPRLSHAVLLKGRLAFLGEKDPAPFPCCVGYRGPRAKLFKQVFGCLGMLLEGGRA